MANPLHEYAQDNADVDLAAGATIFSESNGGSFTRLVVLDIRVGDGTKDLTADADTLLTFAVSNGGVKTDEIEVTIPNGQDRFRKQTAPIVWLAGETLALTCLSDNAGDTDVDATVTAYDVAPLQPQTSGRAFNVTAGGAIGDLGYVDGYVWLSPAGAAGTVIGVNGTLGNPSDSLTDAISVSNTLGNRAIRMRPRGTSSVANYVCEVLTIGVPFVWDINGQYVTEVQNLTINSTGFESIRSSLLGGALVGTSWTCQTGGYYERITWKVTTLTIKERAVLGYCTFREGTAINIVSSIFLASPIELYGCLFQKSDGTATAIEMVTAFQTQLLDLDDCWGHVELRNMVAGQRVNYRGWGTLTIAGTCSGGTIKHTSHVEVTDNSGGAVTVELISEPGGVGSLTSAAQQDVRDAMKLAATAGDDSIDDKLDSIAGGGGGTAGPGARSLTWTTQLAGAGVSGVECWISTDAAGDTVVAGTFITDDSGVARVPGGSGLPMLDEDVAYYGWRDSSTVQFASNPIQFRYSSANARWELWDGAAYGEWT